MILGPSLQLCLMRCSNLPFLGLSVVLGKVLSKGNKVVNEMGEVLAWLLFVRLASPACFFVGSFLINSRQTPTSDQ